MSPGQRKPPAGNRGDSKSTAVDKLILPPNDKNPAHRPSTGRRFWARQLIDRAPKPLPTYGSTAWLAADDATKLGSMAVAAEAWASDSENLEDDLRRETEAFRLGFKAGDDADYAAKAEAHRAKYGNPSTRKSFTERRAAQLSASQPRPDDFTGGGPVTWERGPA